MKKSFYLSILFFLVFSCPTKAQQRLSLSGNDWKIKDVTEIPNVAFCSDWIPATVQGNIRADLETAAWILGSLWYGMGDNKLLYDVAKNWWIYRKEFRIPADFSNKGIRLIFGGVDYTCEALSMVRYKRGRETCNLSWLIKNYERSQKRKSCIYLWQMFSCFLNVSKWLYLSNNLNNQIHTWIPEEILLRRHHY